MSRSADRPRIAVAIARPGRSRSSLVRVLARLWRLLRPLFLTFAAIVLFIEDFGWKPLSAWLGRLADWPPLARLEDRIRRLRRRQALAAFLIPALLLFPLKLIALGLVHRGHPLAGVALVVAAKLLGTALLGRLFVLLEPKLMQFAWFARALGWWRATKLRIGAAVRRLAVWRGVQGVFRILRVRLRRAGR